MAQKNRGKYNNWLEEGKKLCFASFLIFRFMSVTGFCQKIMREYNALYENIQMEWNGSFCFDEVFIN